MAFLLFEAIAVLAEDIVPRLLAPPEGLPPDAALNLQRAAASIAADSEQHRPAKALKPFASIPWPRPGTKRKRSALDSSQAARPEQPSDMHSAASSDTSANILPGPDSPAGRAASQLTCAKRRAVSQSTGKRAAGQPFVSASVLDSRDRQQRRVPSLQSLQGRMPTMQAAAGER